MSEFLQAFRVQRRVIYAFILRETRTKFGRSQLGYFWAFFEPLAYILSLLAIFSVLGRGSPINVDLRLFFFTGIIPWLIFSKTLSCVSGAIDSNQALLNFPQVKTLDIVIAKFILEFVTLFLVGIFYLAGFVFFVDELKVYSLLLVFAGIFVCSLMALGIGLIFGVIRLYFSAFSNFQTVILRIMFFTSGVFFIVDGLPLFLQEWIWYNPLVHLVDWIRSAFFYDFNSNFYSYKYPIFCTLVFLFIGLSMERVTRYKVIG